MMRRSTSLAVCCAPIEDDAERAAALGDVEQDLLDRRVAVARRVLVELVEHDEQQRLALCRLRSLSSNARRSVTPTTNRLRAVVEVVEVDDRDLRVARVDAVARERVGRDVGADEARRATAATTAAGGRTR